MSLVGNAGVRTGVPFPVLARASFGTFGANVPALVRAIVACFWYGAQTAAASGAIVALLIRNEGMLEFHQTSHLLGHSTLEVICYVVIWALQLLIIQRGMETVRRFHAATRAQWEPVVERLRRGEHFDRENGFDILEHPQ